MILSFILLEKSYSIYKFRNGSVLPDWVCSSDFYSITKTSDELSVVALQTDIYPEAITCNRDWRILKIVGPLDFSVTGVIADITDILEKKKISVFVISTYDTDFVLVKQEKLDGAVNVLREKGHNILMDQTIHKTL